MYIHVGVFFFCFCFFLLICFCFFLFVYILLFFSFRVIYNHFCNPSIDAISNRTGIQLLGVVVANRCPPYDPATSPSIDEQKFFSTFVSLMTHKYKDSYAAAAEVLGLTLAYMKEEWNVGLPLLKRMYHNIFKYFHHVN